MTGVLQSWCRQAGLHSAALWAAVPTYVPSAPSPKAALALVDRASQLLEIPIETTELEIASASYERQVSELVSDDAETTDYVEQLERRFDDDDHDPFGDDEESLVDEVERFLRDQRDDRTRCPGECVVRHSSRAVPAGRSTLHRATRRSPSFTIRPSEVGIVASAVIRGEGGVCRVQRSDGPHGGPGIAVRCRSDLVAARQRSERIGSIRTTPWSTCCRSSASSSLPCSVRRPSPLPAIASRSSDRTRPARSHRGGIGDGCRRAAARRHRLRVITTAPEHPSLRTSVTLAVRSPG